jgi:hypothetical protein
MVGTLGVLTASGAKSAVSDILSNLAASADVLALAKIEVEMGAIPEGELGLPSVLSCPECRNCVMRYSAVYGDNGTSMRRKIEKDEKTRSADSQVKT